MSERLIFPDPLAAADLITFAGRAARLGDGAVRLTAESGTLATTAAPLAAKGLGDPTPTVLGLRALPIDPEIECDLVVEASALHLAPDDAKAVVLPETALAPAWAGIAPPRSGWETRGTIPAAQLAARAQWGIAAVAESVPTDAGEDAVRAIRAGVWGELDPSLEGLPLGVAFTAFTLGFIGGSEQARLFGQGPWRRLSLARGHVIARGPMVSGMTAVRPTGRSTP